MSDETWGDGRVGTPELAATSPVGEGRFVRLGMIGQGGMGRVWEANDRQFNRVVALKEVLPGSSQAMHRRFATEALVVAQLDHPAIPAVYERGARADGTPWYAMRRIQGRTLAERLAAATTLAQRLELLPALVQVAQAVAHAHERGVVHRDLKPDNIVLGPHGEAVVLDWGLAKVRGVVADAEADGELSQSGHTQFGAVLGTPAYMAPEQALGRSGEVDERTDVFALGAVLYNVLCGKAPFASATPRESFEAARSGRRPALAEVAPEAPLALRLLAERALAADPLHRPATAGAFADELAAVLVDSVARPVSAPARRLAAAVSGGTAALVVLGAAAAFVSLPSTEEMGPVTVLVYLFAGAGLVLAATEWRTAGRLGLRSMVLALAGVTVLYGVGQTALGLGQVANYVATSGDDTEMRAVAAGVHEALGSVALAGVLASAQLVAWGLLGRLVPGAVPRV